MSHIALPNGDDHPEAAGKHLVDCEMLLAGGRPDGAGYLAGYVIECCLKALVIVGGGAIQQVHDLGDLTREALQLAVIANSRTAKYMPWHTPNHSIYNVATGWLPKLRYSPPGRVSVALAGDWVQEAGRVYSSTVVPMRLDGVI